MDIKGKTILITGAARVGAAVAQAVATRGGNVALTYLHSPEEVAIAEKLVQATGVKLKLFRADLSHPTDIHELVQGVRKEFGSIHVLVHMAAIYPRTPWELLTEETWDRNMDIIGKSTFLLGKSVGDALRENLGETIVVEGKPAGVVKGKIINFSDWSALTRPYKDYLPYNAAKGAVVGITRSLAKELAPDILVNAIAPGPILAPPDLTEKENKEVLARTPLGRWGGSEEIAKAVLYLLDADFVTGQVLPVDGGRTIG